MQKKLDEERAAGKSSGTSREERQAEEEVAAVTDSAGEGAKQAKKKAATSTATASSFAEQGQHLGREEKGEIIVYKHEAVVPHIKGAGPILDYVLHNWALDIAAHRVCIVGSYPDEANLADYGKTMKLTRIPDKYKCEWEETRMLKVL